MGEGVPTFNVTNLKASEMIKKCKGSNSSDLAIIQNHYTKLMNDPIVHLYSDGHISNGISLSYANVKRLSVRMFQVKVGKAERLESPVKLNPLLTHLLLSAQLMEQVINDLAKTPKADNFLSHFSLVACKDVKGELPVLFQSEWPHLKYLDLAQTDVSESDLEFLCLACNGPKKTLSNLTSLGLTIPNDILTDTFCEKLFTLPWPNLKSLYLHGAFDSYTGFTNTVKENKLQNLTCFEIEINRNRPPIPIEALCLDKLTNLQFLHDPDGVVVLPQSFSFELVTAKMGGIPRRGPTTRLAALDAGRIPNRKGTSRCV